MMIGFAVTTALSISGIWYVLTAPDLSAYLALPFVVVFGLSVYGIRELIYGAG